MLDHPFNNAPVPSMTENVRLGNLSHPAKNSRSIRVLIVDDEPLIRWSMSETLGEEGCTVGEAEDARTALQAVGDAGREYDVILLDFRLPDSNDLTLLARLRTLAPHSQVILMSAFGTPEVRQRAIELGAWAVIAKPFEVHELADLVRQAHGDPRN